MELQKYVKEIDGIPGIYVEDLKKWIGEKNVPALNKWLFGKTLLEHEEKEFMYLHDVESFLDVELDKKYLQSLD